MWSHLLPNDKSTLSRKSTGGDRAFKKKEDLNLNNLIPLPYFQAIIDETFRMYPPGLGGQARIAPKGGAVVSGHFVPEGVCSAISFIEKSFVWAKTY